MRPKAWHGPPSGVAFRAVLPGPPSQDRPVSDDEVLTQHGKSGKPFQNTLRQLRHPPGPERDMSLILGAADAVEATKLRFGYPQRDYSKYAVRYTTAGALRRAGFRVEHTGRYPGNPYHVSVFAEGDWGPDQASAFDACFSEEAMTA